MREIQGHNTVAHTDAPITAPPMSYLWQAVLPSIHGLPAIVALAHLPRNPVRLKLLRRTTHRAKKTRERLVFANAADVGLDEAGTWRCGRTPVLRAASS